MHDGVVIGLLFISLGGLSASGFYVPYQRTRGWSWEVMWLAGGTFAWLIVPWVFAFAAIPALSEVLRVTTSATLLWSLCWGAIWGIGGLAFGLGLRYLGVSLGMAVGLGLATVVGTLGPPIFEGVLPKLIGTPAGKCALLAMLVMLCGIVLVSVAGRIKERKRPMQAADAALDFNLKKGLIVMIVAGSFSGCLAWGLDAAQPIARVTLASGAPPALQGLAGLAIVLLGGYATNALWCLTLALRNRTVGEWWGRPRTRRIRSPALLRNYSWVALGGLLWYLQFFFYTMGDVRMGSLSFVSWTVLMASLILFATLWGFALKEWAGVSGLARAMIYGGIGLLIAGAGLIAFGNALS
jgi:L-rhamnose-H+ transport protein